MVVSTASEGERQYDIWKREQRLLSLLSCCQRVHGSVRRITSSSSSTGSTKVGHDCIVQLTVAGQKLEWACRFLILNGVEYQRFSQ